MPFNRVNGFYVGKWSCMESEMTLDEKNDEVNCAMEARLSQMNAALEREEARLKAMTVPVESFVQYDAEPDGPEFDERGETVCYIGMIKLRGSWRFCHATFYVDFDDTDRIDRVDDYVEERLEWKPIVEASIEERINAAKHIDELRAEIVRQKELLIPDLEKAISILARSTVD